MKKIKNIIWSIKRFFNLLSKEQRDLINSEIESLKKLAQEEANKINRLRLDGVSKDNATCPNCKSTNIVNKIQHVTGSGSVSGSFHWGSGYVYGSSSIDTGEVNHCNGCGNQWKKRKMKYDGVKDVMNTWFWDFTSLSKDINDKYRQSTLNLFKPYKVETIQSLINEYTSEYSSIRDIDNNFFKNFRSVWDKN